MNDLTPHTFNKFKYKIHLRPFWALCAACDLLRDEVWDGL